MRIAFTGSHRCGKSTLIAKVAEELDGYEVVDEPYVHLEEEGHDFAHPPSLEDFLAQLECSLKLVDDAGADLLFDRCPIDFVGYLLAHVDADAFDLDVWIDRVRAALRRLDLMVFVPIEDPDRIKVSRSEDLDLRADVDAKLKELILDDRLDIGVEVLVVEGKRSARLAQVLARVRRG